jgi:hypothetical protein
MFSLVQVLINKRFSTLYIFIIIIIVSFNSIAQPVLDSSDIIFPKQSINLRSCNNISNIDYQTTGPDVVWDYSTLITNGIYIDSFFSILNCPTSYTLFYLLNSNIGTPDKTNLNLLNGLQQNPWNFYRKTATKFQQSGYAGEISGLPTPTVYTTPDVLYKFPLKYLNRDSSIAKYTLPASVLVGATTIENKSRLNVVDGWGKLITPFDTINQVLRVHSLIKIEDSITINGTGLNITTRTQHEYKFLAKGLDWPVLQIYTNEFFGVEIVSNVFVRDTIIKDKFIDGILNFNLNNEIKIFPNPANNFLIIELDKSLKDGVKTIYIYDILGRVVRYLNFEGTNGVTDLTGLGNGIYFIKIETQEYSIVNKFVKE